MSLWLFSCLTHLSWLGCSLVVQIAVVDCISSRENNMMNVNHYVGVLDKLFFFLREFWLGDLIFCFFVVNVILCCNSVLSYHKHSWLLALTSPMCNPAIRIRCSRPIMDQMAAYWARGKTCVTAFNPAAQVVIIHVPNATQANVGMSAGKIV